jgi:N-acetyl-beta-hexosaminidase
MSCVGDYEGQFDPTLDLTWEAVGKVFDYVNSTFDDNYIHFGGDEVNY